MCWGVFTRVHPSAAVVTHTYEPIKRGSARHREVQPTLFNHIFLIHNKLKSIVDDDDQMPTSHESFCQAFSRCVIRRHVHRSLSMTRKTNTGSSRAMLTTMGAFNMTADLPVSIHSKTPRQGSTANLHRPPRQGSKVPHAYWPRPQFVKRSLPSRGRAGHWKGQTHRLRNHDQIQSGEATR